MRGRLTDEQIRLLRQPLDPKRVKKAQGNSHLEGWDVRAHLTRIFGFGGWDEKVLSVACIYEHLGNEVPGKEDKDKWYVTYRCTTRLTVWGVDPDGLPAVAGVYEEGAIGGAENQPSHADAHDLAMKESMTQALKRCAINLGTQFGLSLYSDGTTNDVIGAEMHPVIDAEQLSELEEAIARLNSGGQEALRTEWKARGLPKKEALNTKQLDLVHELIVGIEDKGAAA